MSTSLVLSELMVLISFASILPFYCFKHDERQQLHADSCSIISKRFIMTVVLTIITDAMAMGGYISEYNYQLDGYYWTKVIALSFRFLVHVICLCIICYTTHENDEIDSGGVFCYTCGWIQKNGFNFAKIFLKAPSPTSQFTPFQGKGVTLGTYVSRRHSNNHHHTV